MSRKKSNDLTTESEDVTSAGVPWSEVPEFARHHVEWIDGREGPARDDLPPIDDAPIPDALYAQPGLDPKRPTGSKAMIDAHGARCRLANCRPGAWLVSPYTGWKWARWSNGRVDWVAKEVELPDPLRVHSRNDIQ